MKFYKQNDDTSCHLVALQTILSFYGKYPTITEIKRSLPKHTFGNLLPELGLYLEKQGIRTTIVTNNAPVRAGNRQFNQMLGQYQNRGDSYDRSITTDDLEDGPVLVNVDWYKIKNEETGKGGHYVVLLQAAGILWLYDGSNYDSPVVTTLEKIVAASKDTNRWKDNGLFLLCSKQIE